MKTISLVIIAQLLISTSFAATLTEYRKCYFKDPAVVKASAEKRANKILTSLGMTHLPAFSLDLKEQQDRLWNPGYSAVIKDIIKSSMVRSMREIEAMPPEPIDPSLSLGQYKKYLAKVRQLVIMDSLNSKDQKTQFFRNDKEKAKTGLEAVVNDLYHADLLSKTKDKKTKAAINATVVKQIAINDQNKVKSEVTKYINSYSPKNKKGQNIIDILGPVVNVEVIEGAIDEIQFNATTEKETKVSAQFNMFMTQKIGEEEIYLETQNVLLDYLKAQEKVLGDRLKYMENGSSWTYYSALYWAMMKAGIWSPLDTKSKAVLTGSKSELEAEKMKALEDVKKENVGEAGKVVRRHTNMYLEGKSKVGAANEKAFIKERLDQLKVVIPYLEYMNSRSNKTHALLVKLTPEQTNFMAGMFLRFMEDDVVSKIESDALAEIIIKAQKSCGIDYPPDLTYYSLQNRLLTEYELQRYEDKLFQEAQAEDLAEIKARH